MEIRYLVAGNGSGDGDGYGYGYGSSDGSGDGDGDGDGDGNGYGSSDGSGDGCSEVDHTTPIMAWHYLGKREHGGSAIPATVGTVAEWIGDVKLCRAGLHASLSKEDAGTYAAPGAVLCRVACSGRVIFGEDKLVCSRREIVEVLPL